MKAIYLIAIGLGTGVVILAIFLILPLPNSFFAVDSKPSCNQLPNPSADIMSLNKTTWISVMVIRANQTSPDCTVLNPEFLSSAPKLQEALAGADSCNNGKFDLCKISSRGGVKEFETGVDQPDNLNYKSTLTRDEAMRLLENIRMETRSAQSYGDVEYGDKYYQVAVTTTGKQMPPQVFAEIDRKIPSSPLIIEKGQSLRFPITVRTMLTYGKPARINFSASSWAADSNLNISVDPPTVELPERSQTNVTLDITAPQDPRNGTYGIFAGGSTNDGGQFGACFMPCLWVSVGGSPWEIHTSPGFSFTGMGGKTPPKWLNLETTINKDVFHAGETAVITNYLTNDSPNPVTLEPHSLLAVTIYSESPRRGYQYYYTINAQSGEEPLVVEPHSTTVLARPFYWNQTSAHDPPFTLQRVTPGNYTVDAAFKGYDGYSWDNDIPIIIK